MYSSFELELPQEFLDPRYFKIGCELQEEYKDSFSRRINDLLFDEIMDGDSIEKTWFPRIFAEVFLVHSHNDTNLALSLSGWMKENLNIKMFIDSGIWGSADDLIASLDNKFSFNVKTGSYNYKARNLTTSHVHSMLLMSILKMIDQTECLFVLNSKDCTRSCFEKEILTTSPWIYAEMVISKLIRKSQLGDHRTFYVTESREVEKPFEIEYKAYAGHLIKISERTLIAWKDLYDKLQREKEEARKKREIAFCNVTSIDLLYKISF